VALIAIGCPWPLEAAATNLGAFLSGHEENHLEFGPGVRMLRYLQIGQDLKEKNPDATLMTPEIGGLSWSFPGRIIDTGALVTPDALKYYSHLRKAYLEVPPEIVREYSPDFVVILGIWSDQVTAAIADGRLRNYKLMKVYSIFPDDLSRKTGVSQLWETNAINVYAKQP
jgi:hypothetical protein